MKGDGFLNEERAIFREVRKLLGEDTDPPDNSLIKAKLIKWGGGDHFPDEHSWARSSIDRRLVKLFRKHGIAPVLATLKGLEVELRKSGKSLPGYYQGGRPNSKLDQALKIARRNEARWVRERKERKQR